MRLTNTHSSVSKAIAQTFAEGKAWQAVGAGWKQLYGNFQNLGVSFEWHDFTTKSQFDWSKSFHPASIEICLNLLGSGTVALNGTRADFATRTGGFYCHGTSP